MRRIYGGFTIATEGRGWSGSGRVEAVPHTCGVNYSAHIMYSMQFLAQRHGGRVVHLWISKFNINKSIKYLCKYKCYSGD